MFWSGEKWLGVTHYYGMFGLKFQASILQAAVELAWIRGHASPDFEIAV